MRIYVVDVSAVQGRGIDWRQVRGWNPGEAFGGPFGSIQGVIAKASEGARGVDPTVRANLDGARAEGFAVGVYHFARAGRERGWGRLQAERTIALDLGAGDDPGELPIWLDLEEGNAAALSGGPDALVDEALAFLETVEAAGFRAGLYTMPSFGAQWRGARRLAELASRPLWVAHYARLGAWVPGESAAPMKLAPWAAWSLWQFSGGGPKVPGNVVPGILGGRGFVDLNLVADGLAGWRRLLGYGEAEEAELLDGGAVHGAHVVDASLSEYQREDAGEA
jgi:GH25 family lysozyme M1 (1,4-beta-N-acetylmuramidase)